MYILFYTYSRMRDGGFEHADGIRGSSKRTMAILSRTAKLCKPRLTNAMFQHKRHAITLTRLLALNGAKKQM